MLYVVTALMHYIPYSTYRGVLTIIVLICIDHNIIRYCAGEMIHYTYHVRDLIEPCYVTIGHQYSVATISLHFIR